MNTATQRIIEFKAHEAKTYEAEQEAQNVAFGLSRKYPTQVRIYDFIRGMANDLPKMSQSKTEKAVIARNQYQLAMAIN